jgi:hypothetical protein
VLLKLKEIKKYNTLWLKHETVHGFVSESSLAINFRKSHQKTVGFTFPSLKFYLDFLCLHILTNTREKIQFDYSTYN